MSNPQKNQENEVKFLVGPHYTLNNLPTYPASGVLEIRSENLIPFSISFPSKEDVQSGKFSFEDVSSGTVSITSDVKKLSSVALKSEKPTTVYVKYIQGSDEPKSNMPPIGGILLTLFIIIAFITFMIRRRK